MTNQRSIEETRDLIDGIPEHLKLKAVVVSEDDNEMTLRSGNSLLRLEKRFVVDQEDFEDQSGFSVITFSKDATILRTTQTSGSRLKRFSPFSGICANPGIDGECRCECACTDCNCDCACDCECRCECDCDVV